jgi:hypothetical protein
VLYSHELKLVVVIKEAATRFITNKRGSTPPFEPTDNSRTSLSLFLLHHEHQTRRSSE